MFCYAGKILYVDLTKERIWTEDLTLDKIKKFIGGRGMNIFLLWDSIEPGIDPLGEENVLIFGAGALSGTFAPSSGRTTITCKGPATHLYVKSSSGGHWGPELKFAGYDHLVVRGKSNHPVYLWIHGKDVEIRDGSKLWGKDVQETEELIQEELKEDRVEIACIGIGGENRVKFASIMMGHNAAARGGTGAVMGSKMLKAIAVKGKQPIGLNDGDNFFHVVRQSIKDLKESPAQRNLGLYGTVGMIPLRNEMHLLATNNFTENHLKDAYQISGQYLIEKGFLINRFGCSACGTSCHRYTSIPEGRYKGTQSGGPEYESAGALGAGCGVTDPMALLKANELCNRYGLDTVSTGSVIQWAMECYEKGLLSTEETGGLRLEWGNGETVIELIQKIAHRQGLGDLLAQGVKRAAEVVGKDSMKWAIQVKGLEQTRADVRAKKGYALALAVNPRGPDHLHSQVFAEDGTTPETRALIKRICGSEDYATHKIIEKRGAIVRWHEDFYAISDSLGLCTFVTLARGYLIDIHRMMAMYKYAAGVDWDEEGMFNIGRRILTLEKAFNVREGASRMDDTIPWRFMHEPIKSGPLKGMVTTKEQLDQMLDEYYQLHGWDKETSWPLKETLKNLGLDEVAEEMERRGKIPLSL